jgi:hypothetical protein
VGAASEEAVPGEQAQDAEQAAPGTS